MAGRREQEHHSAVPYVLTFVGLLALTGLTFGLSYVNTGSLHIPIALAIASIKGFLVAYWFMHLNEQRGVNAIFFGVALMFIVILIAGVAGDVASRAADVDSPPPALREQLGSPGPEEQRPAP